MATNIGARSIIFIERMLSKELDEIELKAIQIVPIRTRLMTLIYELVEGAVSGRRDTDTFTYFDDMSGQEFEQLCAEQLRRAGWQALLTKATGDQGADIIAERDRIRVVLQCKRSFKPVGNKAVQEAVAARIHESADVACVVSNAGFTQGARELAGTANVPLLHYLDLQRLERIVHGGTSVVRGSSELHAVETEDWTLLLGKAVGWRWRPRVSRRSEPKG